MTHILVVESDPNIRSWLKEKLRDWSYRVSEAKDGQSCMEQIKKFHYDLIIADWVLPEMSGLEFIKSIRSPKAPYSPYLIMLTPPDTEIITGVASGADDFILKPIQSDALRARVMAATRIIQLEQKLTQQNSSLEHANLQMKSDLIVAAKIQNSFLPHTPPQLPEVEFEWGLLPCEELAGDALNMIALDERHIGFYLLDVSGHGVAAALMAMTLVHMLSADKSNSALFERVNNGGEFRILPPGKVAERLNNQFPMDDINGQYFTCIYAILNLDTQVLRYTSAGHPGPILIPGEGKGNIFSSTGMPIGFVPESPYGEVSIQLHDGDRLYVFSDGIPEISNKYDELFGLEKMVHILEKERDAQCSLRESLDHLAEAALKWNGSDRMADDISIIGLEMRSKSKT